MEGLSQAEWAAVGLVQSAERAERRRVTPIVAVLRRPGGENLARARPQISAPATQRHSIEQNLLRSQK